MSNLSRKVKRATENGKTSRKRLEARRELRQKQGMGRALFPSPTEGRMNALHNLSEAQRDALESKLGVINLDHQKYVISVVWAPKVGWWPSWSIL